MKLIKAFDWRWKPPIQITKNRSIDFTIAGDLFLFAVLFAMSVLMGVLIFKFIPGEVTDVAILMPPFLALLFKIVVSCILVFVNGMMYYLAFMLLTLRFINVTFDVRPIYHWWFHIAGTRLYLPEHLSNKDAIHGACDIAHRYLFVFNDTWSNEYRSVTFLKKNDAMRFKLAYF